MLKPIIVACACVCPEPSRRETVVITLESVTMYDVWLWDQGEQEIEPDPYVQVGPDPDYYPLDDDTFLSEGEADDEAP